MKRIVTLGTALSLAISPMQVDAISLSSNQRYIADRIAEITADHWDEYGVLPSVAVAQAFVESSLGDHRPASGNYNCWGILSGDVWYDTLAEGTMGYLRVISDKKYYAGATFKTDYHDQLRTILDGGYCQPEGNYWNEAMFGYRNFGFAKYDEEMFEAQRQEKIRKRKERRRRRRIARRKKRQALREAKRIGNFTKEFTVLQDDSLTWNREVVVSADIFKGTGTIAIEYDLDIVGIYDVKVSKKIKGRTIKINNPKYHGEAVKLIVKEEAKG